MKSPNGGRLFVLSAYAAATLVAFAAVTPLWAGHPILIAAVADLAATVVVFGFSMMLNNSSVYGPYWSVAPPIVVGYWAACAAAAGDFGLRQAVIITLVLVWGIRLTANWSRHWRGPGDEDFLYREIRDKTGLAYWPASFVSIHLMPTFLGFIGLLPLYPALTQSSSFGVVDGIAAALVGSAIAIATVADGQLRRFLKSPHEPNDVVKTGLWAHCRHPNYLGELLFWWGLFLFSLAVHTDWAWTAAGPISITLLLVFVSVPSMDRHMQIGHSGWSAHAVNLPALMPLRSMRPFGPGKMPLSSGWRTVGVVLMGGTLVIGGLLARRYMHSCMWEGKRYYSGQGMGSLDGCNASGCVDGHIMSTQMGCLRLSRTCKDAKTSTKKAIAWLSGASQGERVQVSGIVGVREDSSSWIVRARVHPIGQTSQQERAVRVRKVDCKMDIASPNE